jgi:hypothetical protein
MSTLNRPCLSQCYILSKYENALTGALNLQHKLSAPGNVLYDKNSGMVEEHSDNKHVVTYGLQYSMHNFIQKFVITHILCSVHQPKNL